MAQTPKFFITHSWKDIGFTKRLCDDLRARGLAGFFDAYSVKPGDIISAEITRGLEACDIYVPILSHAALKSPWCEEEIHAAITLGKLPGRHGRPRIIPLLVEDCEDEMPIFLRSRLYIVFAGRYDDALNELLTKGFGLAPTVSAPSIMPPVPTSPTLPTVPRTWIIASGGIVGVLVLCVLAVWIVGQLGAAIASTPTRIAQATATTVPPTSVPIPTTLPTGTPAPTVQPTSAPTFTPTNVPTITPMPPTRIPTSSPTPTLGIGSTKISADGATMMYVPAGKFWMGSSDADKQASDDEKPQHEVDLDAFWIDKFEVTNALYKKCVDASRCTAPVASQSYAHSAYYGNPQYDNYPVVNVSWDAAKSYCVWTGKRLPTEAEWEKSARGADGRIYPWGNIWDGTKANFCDKNCRFGWKDSTVDDGYPETAPVEGHPSGASPYRVMDMAGNVWEWVADWYDANYYSNAPSRNPEGPSFGQYKVLRGGSWDMDRNNMRGANRNTTSTPLITDNVGFRCVQ
jgi:formylglycine-generating enzyme required for sulfatase activity